MPAADPTDDRSDLLRLGDERFVSLSTRRRSGAMVSTPVWFARRDGALVVTSDEGSGKVKRIGNDPRVTLRPCSRTGTVNPDASSVDGVAEIRDTDTDRDRVTQAIRSKYGLEYTLIMLAERVLRRGRRAHRVILRIAPASTTELIDHGDTTR